MVKRTLPFLQIPSFLLSESLSISNRALGIVRCVILGIHLIVLGVCYSCIPFVETFKFLTFWGFYLTISYFFLTSADFIWGISKSLKRIAFITFEIAFAVEFVISFFYWAFVFPLTKDLVYEKEGEIYIQIYLHGIILLSIYIDFALNSLVFKASDIKYVITTLICYSVVGYLWTILIKPVYPILTFKDWTSYFFVFIGLASVIAHFYIGCLCSSWSKKPKINKLSSTLSREKKEEKCF